MNLRKAIPEYLQLQKERSRNSIFSPLLIGTIISLLLSYLILSIIYLLPFTQQFDMTTRPVFFDGLYPPEHNTQFTYAYSDGHIQALWPNIGCGNFLVSLEMGAPAANDATKASLAINSLRYDLGTIGSVRRFQFIVPTDTQCNLQFQIVSNTQKISSDPRALGVFIKQIDIQSISHITPPLHIVATCAIGTIIFLVFMGLTFSLSHRLWLCLIPGLTLPVIIGWYIRNEPTFNSSSIDKFLLLSCILLIFSSLFVQGQKYLRSNRLTYLLVSSSVIIPVVIFLWHVSRHYNFMIDDTYISLVYVKNFLYGKGLTFNGTYVAGYSNFLWVIIISFFGMSGADILLIAKILGIACGLAIMLLIPLFSYRYLGNLSAGVIATLLLAFTSPFVVWSVAGLETTAFGLLILASITLILAEERHSRAAWSGLALLGLALTRPEGIGLVIVLQTMRLGWYWLAHKDQWRHRLLLGLAAPFIGYAVFMCWHTYYYGYPLPTTVYAKTGDTAGQITKGIAYLTLWFQQNRFVYGAALLGTPFLLLRPPRFPNILLAGTIAAYLIFIVTSGGDWMPAYRFVIPILPLIFLMLGQLIVLLSNMLSRLRPLLSIAILLLLTFWTTSSTWAASENQYTYLRSIAHSVETTNEIGREVGKFAHSEDTIALIDAGAIPFFTDAHIIDMVGLNDNYIAHLPGGFLNKYDNDYVLAQKPTYIHLHLVPYANSWAPTDFIGSSELYYSAEFHQYYEQMREIPYIFKRRQTPLSDAQIATFYNANYQAQVPHSVSVNTKIQFPLTLTNNGYLLWQSHSVDAPWGAVRIVAEWCDTATGRTMITRTTTLPRDVLPGDQISFNLQLQTPDTAGTYELRLNLERARIYRFSDKHVPSLQTIIKVQ